MIKSELQALSNVLNDRYGFKVIFKILTELGAFERGINRNSSDKDCFMTLGKREKGLWLLDCIRCANVNKYIELLQKSEGENYD